MLTRWIIRLVVIVSVLLLGVMADAQQRSGGGGSGGGASSGGGGSSASSGGGGGGARASGGGGSSASSGSSKSGGGGSSTSSGGSATGNRGGTASSGSQATTPPRTGSAISGTGSAVSGTGSAISGTGSAISGTGNAPSAAGQTGTRTSGPGGVGQPGSNGRRIAPPAGEVRPAPGSDEDRRERLGQRPRPRPNDPNQPIDPNRPKDPKQPHVIYIHPQQYGWAPYTWWYRGNSHWFPSSWNDEYYGDGYTRGGYYDGEDDDRYDRRYDGERYDRTASPPAASLPQAPSPAQEQARAVNAAEGMPAYSQAMLEFKAAQAAYEEASARVLARLREDPEYKRLVAQRDAADERVEAVQAGANVPPNPGRVLPAAQRKLEVSSKVTKMEQDAIAADREASSAKAKMVEANERLAALRKQAEASGGRAQ